MNQAQAGNAGFTHLHVHSHFSLLGGTAAVDALAAQAVADGMTHLALTDSNALYGAVAFSRACGAADLQPILGMTVAMAPLRDSDASDHQGTGLLVLLATGPVGYRSLCRLSSQIQAHPNRLERAAHGLDWEALQAQRAGLICLSGGRRGWIERYLRAGSDAGARQVVRRLAAIFGEDAFLSLEWHRARDETICGEIAGLAQSQGLPTVAVQPIYCLAQEERRRLRLLTAIGCNCPLDEVPAVALPDDGEEAIDLHWLPPAEVARRHRRYPEALAAAAAIATRCRPALPDGSPIWPALKLSPGQSADQALAELAQSGLVTRYGPQASPAAADRLGRELAAIADHGYSPLFLLVADVVRFARSQDIPVSTRGSVANSLVAYCTGITTVDPVEHDLLFERFLSPARGQGSAPDIDLDFCSRRRDQVLEYVRRSYGEERVALVATISTMRLKSAVRETGKAYRVDESTIARLVKRLPRGWHPDPRRRSRRTVEDVLQELPELTDDRETAARLEVVVREAAAIEGQPHHLSIHPGGIVITPGPLTDILPLQWTAKGFLITQFGHEDVEAIGLPKIDLLGIRALTVLADAAGLVRRHHDPAFRLANIPLDDQETGDLLARADTIGVFQCESVGARRTVRQLKARTVRDLAVANAFFKPGPATGGMARAFVRRYRGEAAVTFLHPALEPILGATMGVLIFQEQVLRVATEIAGLDWQQADHLRRGMSKFQPQEMDAIRAAFMAGCTRPEPDGPGLAERQAATLWEQVIAFAGYGFNQGHATAYADVSYRSAYLKAHWPAAFLCARLADWGGFHHPAVYMAEAVRLGIDVRPPHVNRSNRKFTLTWDDGDGTAGGPGHPSELSSLSPAGVALSTPQLRRDAAQSPRPILWMGLGQVRDLRQSSVRAIVEQRRERAFDGLRDLLNRVPLQPKEAVHLVQCGALDGLGRSRADLLAALDDVHRAGTARQLAFAFAARQVEPESAVQRLAWEMHLLGQPLSVHPLDVTAARAPEVLSIDDMTGRRNQLAGTAGVRLPGWTGSDGFYLGDGRTFAVCTLPPTQKAPPPWLPVQVQGRWREDAWGGGRIEALGWEELPRAQAG